MNTTRKGEIACLEFELEAIKRDYIVSKPITEERYDRIVDINGKLHRVQVKYADHNMGKGSGSISVRLGTVVNPKSYKQNEKYLCRRYTEEEVDAVVAYIPKIEKLIWIDSKLFNNQGTMNIRLEPSKNGQKKGCKFVEDFIW